MTNGDKIRSMSDAELAELLHNAGGNWYTVDYLTEWLSQEFDEDHDLTKQGEQMIERDCPPNNPPCHPDGCDACRSVWEELEQEEWEDL